MVAAVEPARALHNNTGVATFCSGPCAARLSRAAWQVYSGKGMDGLIDQVRAGYFDGMADVVFLHTGGSAAVFGYPDTFELPGYQG